MKYYKFLDKSLMHYGFRYVPGKVNTDVLPFNPSGDCEPGGLYFSREDCLAFVDEFVCEVEPIGEVYLNPGSPVKWKAHSLKLGPLMRTVDVLDKIIADGADIHAHYDSALRWASSNGHKEIAKLLLKAGADIHVCGDMVLRWASKEGHTEIVELLLKAGADTYTSADYDFALKRASYNGHKETVKLLIAAGAKF